MDCRRVLHLCHRVQGAAIRTYEYVENLDSTNALSSIQAIRNLCDELEREVTPPRVIPAGIGRV